MKGALNLSILLVIIFSEMLAQDTLVDAAMCPKFCKTKARNGKCDSDCNIEACNYDAGECNKPSNSNQAYEYLEYYEYIGYESSKMEYEKNPKPTAKPTNPTKSPTTLSPTPKPTKPTKKPTKPTRTPTTGAPTRRPIKPTQNPTTLSPSKSKTTRPTTPKI